MNRVQDELKWIFAGIIFLCIRPAVAQNISGQISKVGDATHIEFSGRTEWKYDAQKSAPGKVALRIPAFDENTEARLKSWSDGFIKSITIDKNGPDRTYVLTFELADPSVEHFDYLTDDPSRLIIDFYRQVKAEPAVVEKKATEEAPIKSDKQTTKLPEKKLPNTDKSALVKKSTNRKPANTELIKVDPVPPQPEVKFEISKTGLPETGVFDGGDPDYSRFQLKDYEIKEEAVISSQQNIYLKFPILKMPVGRFKELSTDKPEYVVELDINPSIRKENAEARFLIQLYEKQRFGAFEKTYKYFTKQYPKSKYDEIVRNLNAEIKMDQYLKDRQLVDYEEFRSELKYLVETYPTSSLVERQRLILGYAALEANDGAVALQELQEYQRLYPKSDDKDLVDLAIAEAYLMLKKSDNAVAIYQELEKAAKDKNLAVEAAYRIGDVFFINKNYKMAADSYERVIQKYPEHAKIYPNAHYNLSESYFWQGKYKPSLDQYITFLKTFPIHDHGGYALTRVGELLGILGADQPRVMGAFLESYFRYPNSAGAGIAKIRMLSQQFKSMKEKEKTIALKEIQTIGAKTDLPRMDEFIVLMISDGQNRRGEYREALDRLLKYFQSSPTTASFKVIEARILKNIADVLVDDVTNGRFYEALSFNSQFANTWLKNANRVDTKYYQGRAFELAGAYEKANEIYGEVIQQMTGPDWKKEEKTRKVLERIPTLDEVYLRQAATLFEQKKYPESTATLGKIKSSLSPENEIEKVYVSARVAERMGDYASAIKYYETLVNQWKGEPELIVEPYLKLGELSLVAKNLEEADKAVTYIENLKKNNIKVSDEAWLRTLQLKAEHRYKSGQKLASVESYLQLLDTFEGQKPLQNQRYTAGLILYEEGDVRGAEKIWGGLSKDSNSFYAKLAQDKLAYAGWQDTHKKYIDRIPAAEGMR